MEQYSENLMKLLGSIRVIDQYQLPDYTHLEFDNIEALTELGAKIDGKWYPKVALMCDPDDDLYVSNWLLAKM